MQIFVKTLSSNTLTLEVDANDTIHQVRLKFVEIDGVPLELQRLIYAGKLLDDERTLADYNIQKLSTLQCIWHHASSS